MAFTIATALSLMLVATVHCYPGGAPVGSNPEICSDSMMPQHEAAAQNSAAPYKLVVAGCYKAGQPAKVTVQATSGHYEGLFMLARSGDDKKKAYGTFLPDNSNQFKTVDCYKQSKSAITQSSKKDYTSEVFWWTAPDGFNDTIHFQATVVMEKDEFWVDVKSSDITYSETCVKESSGAARLRLPAGLLVALALVAGFLRLQ